MTCSLRARVSTCWEKAVKLHFVPNCECFPRGGTFPQHPAHASPFSVCPVQQESSCEVTYTEVSPRSLHRAPKTLYTQGTWIMRQLWVGSWWLLEEAGSRKSRPWSELAPFSLDGSLEEGGAGHGVDDGWCLRDEAPMDIPSVSRPVNPHTGRAAHPNSAGQSCAQDPPRPICGPLRLAVRVGPLSRLYRINQ